MGDLAYGSKAYHRAKGNFPPLECENLRLVKSETSQNSVALNSRYGLGLLATNGTGPVWGIFSSRGTLNGDDFSISGGSIYRGTVNLGTIAGTGPAKFAGGFNEILFTRGTTLRHYNGTTLTNVTFPDGAGVRSVVFIGSLFVAARADGSGKFYWSAPLDGKTWDALNFATAEREPDALLDIAALGDNIWLFGQSTVEAWSHTGDADLPFTRIEQVAFDKGLLQTGCVAPADNSLYFVGSDARVYRIGETPQRVSPEDIEEKIALADTVSLFTYLDADGEYIALRLEGNGTDTTYELNIASGNWAQMTSGDGQWVARCAAMKGTNAYFGHHSTGEIMGWSAYDDMGATMTRRFTAALQLDTAKTIDNIWLWVNSGSTDLLTGQGSDPKIEMRRSRDGSTWTDWNGASLGTTGQFRTIPQWRRLGAYDAPGALFEFRVTDPVPFRMSAVKYNEPVFGRSRG